ASSSGIFYGQCAEFCGRQHANMMIRVVVESPAEFADWLEAQRRPAAAGSAGMAGSRLFYTKTCANCHTIRGTPAFRTVGPDLTHLASRQTIAAEEIPNDRKNLSAWLNNPDVLKPGCRMPDLKLSPDDVASLVSYLESLR